MMHGESVVGARKRKPSSWTDDRDIDRSRVTLIALDFDGTVAPIDVDPSRVKIDPAAAEFLAEAAGTPGVVVAVASGRDVDDLAEKLDGIPVYLIASHGLEIRGPQGRCILRTEPLKIDLDDSLRRSADLSGFRIERKRHGIALHWRGVPYLHGRHPVVERFRDWAQAHGLELIEGRCVVEARLAGGGKEAALRWVKSATATERVIFAGDDVTDFGALRYAARNGMALFVRSSERTPPDDVVVVDSCEELLRVLRSEVAV